MSQPLNTRDLETRVRQRVHDLNSRTYAAREILLCADDEVRRIYSRMRSSGDSWTMDYEDVSLSTTGESGVYEFQIPRYMTDIQLVEAISTGSSVAVPIPKVSLEWKDLDRNRLVGGSAVWLFGRNNTVQVRGSWVSTLPTLRVWFLRSVSAMTYGQAAATSTTTSMKLGNVIGDHKNRTDYYRGMEFEITRDDASPTNVGRIARCSAYDPITLFAALTEAYPAAPVAATEWALIVPVPAEYCELLIERIAVHLLSRSGDAEEYALHVDHMNRLENEFEANIGNRQTGEPRRIYNSRMR